MAEKSKRRFAGMDRQKQREIASKGGKAAHAKGTAHEFTPEEAREAGRKGGQAAHQRGTAHQFTPEEARAAGRKGGRSSRRGTADQLPQAAPEAPRPPEANGAAGDHEPGGNGQEPNRNPQHVPHERREEGAWQPTAMV
jgi:general stress protein YciG